MLLPAYARRSPSLTKGRTFGISGAAFVITVAFITLLKLSAPHEIEKSTFYNAISRTSLTRSSRKSLDCVLLKLHKAVKTAENQFRPLKNGFRIGEAYKV